MDTDESGDANSLSKKELSLSLARSMAENIVRKANPNTIMAGAKLSIWNAAFGTCLPSWVKRASIAMGSASPRSMEIGSRTISFRLREARKLALMSLPLLGERQEGILDRVPAGFSLEFFDCADCPHPALVQNSDSVREGLHLFEVVRGQNDGDAPFERRYLSPQPPPCSDIKAERRFVEEENLRVGDERHRDTQTALHAT